MSFMSKLLKQCRKPNGLFGKMVARGMNRNHARMNQWGMSKIPLKEDMIALDIGCGGGGNIRWLANKLKKGMVYGIDYSQESVNISRKVNAERIKTGRVIIQSGTVSALPYEDNFFDLVTAVETHYFWPDLSSDLEEVLRVLKPSGVFVIIGGEYKGGKYDERNASWVQYGKMTYLTLDELSELLMRAGFVDVAIHEAYEKGWLCAEGIKPVG